jgi:hypothetical protein
MPKKNRIYIYIYMIKGKNLTLNTHISSIYEGEGGRIHAQLGENEMYITGPNAQWAKRQYHS